MFQDIFKGVLREFLRCFKEVSIKFQGWIKKVLSVFQECFNEVLVGNFDVAWITSQLPEQ